MKYFLLVFSLLLSFHAICARKVSVKDYTKAHASVNFGYTTIDLPFGTFSDPGLTFNIGYFFLPKLSFNGHYFLTSSPTGASNMNGFGLQAKYYFYNTEASFELKHNDGMIKTFDRYFAYGSFNFLDRDIRTSRLNISYTGFGASLGGGYKIDFRNSIGIDLLAASLQNPAGSSAPGKATFTNFSVFYTYLF